MGALDTHTHTHTHIYIYICMYRGESTNEAINYGRFINQFPTDTIKSMKRLGRIQTKICRQRISILFNEICINEEMLPKYTHTHTYIYIYIYIYIYSASYYEIFNKHSCKYTVDFFIHPRFFIQSKVCVYIYIYIYNWKKNSPNRHLVIVSLFQQGTQYDDLALNEIY